MKKKHKDSIKDKHERYAHWYKLKQEGMTQKEISECYAMTQQAVSFGIKKHLKLNPVENEKRD